MKELGQHLLETVTGMKLYQYATCSKQKLKTVVLKLVYRNLQFLLSFYSNSKDWKSVQKRAIKTAATSEYI